MVDHSKEAQDRAEAKRRKATQEGAKATAEYEAAAKAIGEKTARLKALRLAKEAADINAAESQPVAAKPSVKSKAAKKPVNSTENPVPLSEWLKNQQGDGRGG